MAQKKNGKKALEAELSALIPLLDEEGLSFLIRQANIHLYNMEVDRLNAEEEARALKASKKKASTAGKTKTSAKKEQARTFTIKHSPSAACYHFGFGGNWKLFTEDEIFDLVRISKAKESAASVRRSCFNWLARERRDALSEWGISSPEDNTMVELVKLLKEDFAIKRGQKK